MLQSGFYPELQIKIFPHQNIIYQIGLIRIKEFKNLKFNYLKEAFKTYLL